MHTHNHLLIPCERLGTFTEAYMPFTPRRFLDGVFWFNWMISAVDVDVNLPRSASVAGEAHWLRVATYLNDRETASFLSWWAVVDCDLCDLFVRALSPQPSRTRIRKAY